MYVCVSVGVYAVSMQVPQRPEEALDILELGLPVFVSCLTSMLETELGSSEDQRVF